MEFMFHFPAMTPRDREEDMPHTDQTKTLDVITIGRASVDLCEVVAEMDA